MCLEDCRHHSIIIIILDTTNTLETCANVCGPSFRHGDWIFFLLARDIRDSDRRGFIFYVESRASETGSESEVRVWTRKYFGLGTRMPTDERSMRSIGMQKSVYDCDANCRSFQLFQHARKDDRRGQETPSDDIGSGKNKKVVVTINDIPKQTTTKTKQSNQKSTLQRLDRIQEKANVWTVRLWVDVVVHVWLGLWKNRSNQHKSMTSKTHRKGGAQSHPLISLSLSECRFKHK